MPTYIVSVNINGCVVGSGLTIEDAMDTVVFPTVPFSIDVYLRCLTCDTCIQHYWDGAPIKLERAIIDLWDRQLVGSCRCTDELVQTIATVSEDSDILIFLLTDIHAKYGANTAQNAVEAIKDIPIEERSAALRKFINESGLY